MRVIAGQFKGKTLASVGKGDTAAHLRPTSDRVRENIFNVISSGSYGDPLSDANVLDVFAGTGALGIEALSRGAAHTTFVDNGTKARALISENIQLTRTQGVTQVLRRDATRLGDRSGTPFDLVFLDPPYGLGLGEKALKSAIGGNWLAPGALIIWEENAKVTVPISVTLCDQRKYGDTQISILRMQD